MAQTVQTLATTAFLSVPLPLDDLPRQYTYDSNGIIQTAVVEYYGVTYTKTFTFTAGLLTNVSQWTPPA